MARNQKSIKRGRESDTDTDSENEIYMNNDKNWPRPLIIESASKDLPLQKLSAFAVQKGLPSNCRNPEEHQETERLERLFLGGVWSEGSSPKPAPNRAVR